MAELIPGAPQVNDPELEADLIRVLSIVGPLGKLNVLDLVIPMINLGDVRPQTVDVRLPAIRSTDVFSNGVQKGVIINTILADTGALPEGTYDVGFQCQGNDNTAASGAMSCQLQHRNAANNANLALWDHVVFAAEANVVHPFYGFGYVIAANERLRCLVTLALNANRAVNAVIFARIRS